MTGGTFKSLSKILAVQDTKEKPQTSLIWFKEQNTTGFKHGDESLCPRGPAFVPMSTGAEREGCSGGAHTPL